MEGPTRKIWLLLSLLGLLSAVAGQAEPARPGEWPGLWGPERNAHAAGSLDVAPNLELKELWRRPIGKGFSEVAVALGRGYTMFSDGTLDHLTALDVGTGKELWRRQLEATYRGHDGSDDGPISTPVVDAGRVFALNPWGKLFAFDAATGRALWQRDLKSELGAAPPFYGFATTPLPVGKTLVVQAGGTERNNLVALDPATGKTLWSSQPASQTGYSSPVLMTLAGVPQIVAAASDRIFAVKPEDGSLLWSHPALGEARQPPVLLPGNRLFVTCFDESAVLEVTNAGGTWKVKEVWRKPVLKSNYSPTVYHQGYLYGMNGAVLMCLDAATGEPKWKERVYNGSLILVGGHLAVIGERSGNFLLIEATPEKFREKLKARVFTPGALSMTGPIFVGGRFLLRNGEEMVMLELVAGKASAPEKEKGKGS